ncbi:MAG: aminotransferase class I/II-fold pyridoxal phosphate-dependent enzyme [Deltaproteobacteria bacterium]|nr:aminotransferase class I/II-fold pyridoxal phosphate-dependent enzyme [Deltaproteobacteria bacterium]
MDLVIDLRSDTVTKPSPAMRRAMANAEVGDDVFGEDPTVNLLEQVVAERLGKEAALFVASGTMGNQIAVRAQTEPGDEVICDVEGHTYGHEGSGMSAISGVQPRTLSADRGLLDAARVEAAIMPDDVHCGRSRLVIVENTANRGGGTIYSLERLGELADVCARHDLRMHMDGARLWNAHVATGVPLPKLTHHADSVSVCLSKGLGAPAGSVLVGRKSLIDRARRIRKMLGGGMRQAGILAAAGLYALENNLDRLAEDHRKLADLMDGLRGIEGLIAEGNGRFPTNIAFIGLEPEAPTAAEYVRRLRDQGVLVFATGVREFRIVTHLDLDVDAVPQAIRRFRAALG